MRGKDPARDKRPVNLNLTTIHFPCHAIASLMHRISGFILFLFIPLLLWILQTSLASYEQFLNLQDMLATPFFKLILWGLLSAFLYHLLAGIRHLIMDFGYGESLSAARLTAQLVLLMGVLLSVALGVWLW